jgi:hypothetical protein
MRPGFDLDGGTTAATGGAFFLCTETWPRCFVIKQVGAIHRFTGWLAYLFYWNWAENNFLSN